MKPLPRLVALLGLALWLAGCVGPPRLQQPVIAFGEATHEATDAEAKFLDAVLRTDCDAQSYESAAQFALGQTKTIDLSGACTPRTITKAQIDRRNALLSAVVLYADKMQAIVGPAIDVQFEASMKTLDTNLNGLLSTGGLKNLGVAQDVEAAIEAIAELAINQYRASQIQDAARKMDRPLHLVVDTLEEENRGVLAPAFQINLQATAIAMQVAIKGAQQREGAGNFFNILEARRLNASADPLRKNGILLAGPPPTATDIAKPFDDLLELIATGNHAIADAKPGSLIDVAADLLARAKAAQDFLNGINGS